MSKFNQFRLSILPTAFIMGALAACSSPASMTEDKEEARVYIQHSGLFRLGLYGPSGGAPSRIAVGGTPADDGPAIGERVRRDEDLLETC